MFDKKNKLNPNDLNNISGGNDSLKPLSPPNTFDVRVAYGGPRLVLKYGGPRIRTVKYGGPSFSKKGSSKTFKSGDNRT